MMPRTSEGCTPQLLLDLVPYPPKLLTGDDFASFSLNELERRQEARPHLLMSLIRVVR